TPGAAPGTPATLAPSSELVINEWLTNPLSGSSPWFELYNPDPSLPIALQGLYAQTPSQLARFNALSFMPPASFLQVFADTTIGGNHLDFSLPTTASTLSLLDVSGATINTATLDALASNVSEGHLPDGASTAAVTFAVSTPGATNAQPAWTGPVWSEVMALDTLDGHPGWVELYNPTASAYNLGGLKVGATSSSSSAWSIPAGTTIPANGYLTFWCDASQPASTVTGAGMNTGFNLNGSSGGIYLFNSTGQPVAQQQWGFQIPNMSIGAVSGGSTWNLLATPTPGAANSGAATFGSTSNLRINEWLAAESTGNDWFELYNLDTLPVALAGLYLTDDPSTAGQSKFQIASLSFIAGHGFVQYQADDSPSSGSNHVNFKINDSGEYLQIAANDGNYTPIDAVSFGIQTTDVSEGRYPDGSNNIQGGLTPTPDGSNALPPAVIALSFVARGLLAFLLFVTGLQFLRKRRIIQSAGSRSFT
ncbi:MAG TPA: lamin tail domain-containing protein, partial [Verrucomicrobiae bacterium]|nr:lamin tail domain-containing protein [Verrucomicrobiae bacterium]